MSSLQLIATAAFGLEAIVVRELESLGYEARIVRPGRIAFAADPLGLCRANLWLRTADRVLIELANFEAADFDALFDTVGELPWETWIEREAAIPVRGRSHRSQLSSVPAIQRTVKRAIVDRLQARVSPTLPETGPPVAVEVSLVDNRATIDLDTSGDGLHRRGYRRLAAPAQLRETLAAALVSLSFWKPGRPLVDPFCGSGTILIEAVLQGRNLAPGRNRQFAAEAWPAIDASHWEQARAEADDRALPPLEERLIGHDIDAEVLQLARYHAEQAGVADDIHFQERHFAELSSPRQYGCLITNPPYGLRMGDEAEVAQLYASMPRVLRRLKTWSHYILTPRPDFEQLLGQQADRRRKLYNGPIACTYYQFHGPRPPRNTPQESSGSEAEAESSTAKLEAPAAKVEAPAAKTDPTPAFGGLKPEATRQAEEFANRLKKRARHLRRWPTRRGITCYRLYERDIPEIPLVVDRYDDALHVTEYERPHDRTPAEHADWLDLMARTAAGALEIPRNEVYLKRRQRLHGPDRYQQLSERQVTKVVEEGGLKFLVNLTDYVDTGLFLDHRQTRVMVRDEAAAKRFLNLFGYTGTFTVYAAAGGAVETTTVDSSTTYLNWAEENLKLNGFELGPHRLMRRDALTYLESLPVEPLFDLAVVDPPTYSNSKSRDQDWEIQRDYAPLLRETIRRLAPGGVLYFSTNFRRFRLEEDALRDVGIREISRQTVPEDFRNERIHRCWRMVKTGP